MTTRKHIVFDNDSPVTGIIKISGDVAENAEKSSGSDIDTGTDNEKYVTPKAIKDSKLASKSFVIAMS